MHSKPVRNPPSCSSPGGAAGRCFPGSSRAAGLRIPVFQKKAKLVLALSTGLAGGLDVRGQAAPNPIEVFVDRAVIPVAGPDIEIPPGSSEIRFQVNPKSLLVRYKLEGLDADWRENPAEMNFSVRFFDKTRDHILQRTFPVSGTSAGWRKSVGDSKFQDRQEMIIVPEEARYLKVGISSAGSPNAVGVFAVTEVSVSTYEDGRSSPLKLMEGSRVPGAKGSIWLKGGLSPSMAIVKNFGSQNPSGRIFIIVDDDLTAHGDWFTRVSALPKVEPGQTLEIRWKEAFNTGLGGPFSVIYERLPPGSYRFVVEEMTIEGLPLKSISTAVLDVPRPYWKSIWFWAGSLAGVFGLGLLYVRYLIRRKINRHLRHAQLIADERLRIARDLHDDLGTRLSHISLLGTYAESTVRDAEACSTFKQISGMCGELINALSETVWMLNSKNDELEALVDYLCKLVSQLCKLAEIRCRIDALSITENVSISHEFRHNVCLAVKEAVNNALKHSGATEINLSIQLEGGQLKISVTDNGIGLGRDAGCEGNGLGNIAERMAVIRGDCSMADVREGGLRVSLCVPLNPSIK